VIEVVDERVVIAENEISAVVDAGSQPEAVKAVEPTSVVTPEAGAESADQDLTGQSTAKAE
jgi:hypothetical protein